MYTFVNEIIIPNKSHERSSLLELHIDSFSKRERERERELHIDKLNIRH